MPNSGWRPPRRVPAPSVPLAWEDPLDADDVGEPEDRVEIVAARGSDRIDDRARAAAGVHLYRLSRHLVRPYGLADRIASQTGPLPCADDRAGAQIGQGERGLPV